MATKIKQKESDVQRTILEWLSAKNIFHYRNNSGVMISEYKGRRSFTKFGAVGSPDIIIVSKGRFIGIEVKGTNGKQTENQKTFEFSLKKAGGIYILVHSFEEFEKMYSSLDIK